MSTHNLCFGNIDCGYTLEPPRRGGSYGYPQSVFWSKNKKKRYTPAYPSFAIKKLGIRGSSLLGHVFVMNSKQEPGRNTIKTRVLFHHTNKKRSI